MSLNTEINSYLTKNKATARDTERTIQAGKNLVMFGEMHVGLSRKASFFANILRSGRIRYHASEYFLNTQSYGQAVDNYLHGRATSSTLPGRTRPLAPVLDAIKPNISTMGLVFGGSGTNNTLKRDRPIFNNFKSSRALHLRAGRFGTNDKGHFHIGGDHASRFPPSGVSATTTQLLINDGFDVGVVRLVVDVNSQSSSIGWGSAISAGERIIVEPISGGSTLDLMPILRTVAGGNPFGADLRLTGSPFRKVRPEGRTSRHSYADNFDVLIFLP